MYHFLSVLAGLFIALMVLINGELTSIYGIYSATVIIHIVGLAFASFLLIFKRKNFLPAKKLPFHLYLGGVIGVATVVFNNISFGKISLSAILALGLLGQSITSFVLDKYGFWGMPKHPFLKQKLLGMTFVMLGIVLMVLKSDVGALIPIIVSLLTGVSIVVSRTINASLAEHTSVPASTFFNYATGLVVSVICLVIFGRNEQMIVNLTISKEAWLYLGGIIGVCVITLLNVAVCKISSFYMTLLLFSGQVFSGIALDIVLSGSFSVNNFIGGIFVTLGLVQNLLVDRKNARESAKCST